MTYNEISKMLITYHNAFKKSVKLTEKEKEILNNYAEELDMFIENEFEEKENTEEKRKLIELPCKIGDTIYLVYENCEITNWEITHIEISKKNITFIIKHKKTKLPCFVHLREFEKSFFLTRKEAKKRLKELQNKNAE